MIDLKKYEEEFLVIKKMRNTYSADVYDVLLIAILGRIENMLGEITEILKKNNEVEVKKEEVEVDKKTTTKSK